MAGLDHRLMVLGFIAAWQMYSAVFRSGVVVGGIAMLR